MVTTLSSRHILIASALLFSLAPAYCAAELYKCINDGKTTYQSDPCKGEGKEVHVAPAPSAEAVREAQARAANDAQAANMAGIQRHQREMQAQYRAAAERQPTAPDCAKLNKDVADAYGQRNGLNRASREMGVVSGELKNNLDQAAATNNQRIAQTQQAANQAGCH
jgi:hypothetical protein